MLISSNSHGHFAKTEVYVTAQNVRMFWTVRGVNASIARPAIASVAFAVSWSSPLSSTNSRAVRIGLGAATP